MIIRLKIYAQQNPASGIFFTDCIRTTYDIYHSEHIQDAIVRNITLDILIDFKISSRFLNICRWIPVDIYYYILGAHYAECNTIKSWHVFRTLINIVFFQSFYFVL